MATTDAELLATIQRTTLEGDGTDPLTWPSGMWTLAEVLGYATQRQNRFLQRAAVLWTVLEQAVAVQSAQTLPVDWVATLLVASRTAEGYREVPTTDPFALDRAHPGWQLTASTTHPYGYYEIDGETRTGYLVPAPTADVLGLELYYVALGTALDASGIDLSIPDEYVPTLKAGILADLFSKVGEGQNLSLAAVCESRWEEGVQVATLQAIDGWLAL